MSKAVHIKIYFILTRYFLGGKVHHHLGAHTVVRRPNAIKHNKIYEPNVFTLLPLTQCTWHSGTKYFFTQKFFYANFFWPQILFTQIFFLRKFFLTKFFFYAKIFITQNFFDPKIRWTNFFTKIFFYANFFFDPNFCLTQKFLRKNNFWFKKVFA